MANYPCGLRVGVDAIVNVVAMNRSLVKQTRTGEKTSKFCVFGYPLSESVAPPGTAWDAEGQRGNEANENNIMVLAPALSRKRQSESPFAQEAMTVRKSVASIQWPVARTQKHHHDPGLLLTEH
jgi:hypothetical protein